MTKFNDRLIIVPLTMISSQVYKATKRVRSVSITAYVFAMMVEAEEVNAYNRRDKIRAKEQSNQ
jgi:hypothetical protein